MTPLRTPSRGLRNLGRGPRDEPRRVVVVISGPVRGGKSTLAEAIRSRFDADVVRTKQILIDEYGAAPQVRARRRRLQELGEQLDRETGGSWVASAVEREARALARGRPLVVDAVRIPAQIDLLREIPAFRVVHFDVTAPLGTLEKRYAAMAGSEEELPSYDEVRQNPTEANIQQLRSRTKWRFDSRLLPRRIVGALAISIVWIVKVRLALRGLPQALLVGAVPVAVCLTPFAWFLTSWDSFGILMYSLIGLVVGMFLLASALVGSAITRLSPIERDPAS